MAGPDVRGRFVWYDLMTTDPAAAQRFYTEVVGWSTEAWQGSDMPYTMWVGPRGPIGGVMQLPEPAAAAGAPPHWLAYMGTPDVDRTAEQAKQLGGQVLHGPMDIPGVGRFAVLQDPQGAAFAAFTPSDDMSVPDAKLPGEVSWNELVTTDYRKGFEFYAALFGWQKTGEFDMGEMGMYHMYGLGEQTYGGMFNKSPDMPMPPCWVAYFKVDDLDAAVARVRRSGGTVMVEPMEVPGGDRIAQGMDPQGGWFALHSSAA